MALLSDIQNITGGNSACDIVQIPVVALKSAADSLDQMKNNPPAAIRDLTAELNALAPPTIPGIDALSDGIASITAEIPTDLGELTQPLADAISEFFDMLKDNFGGKLDEALIGFTGLGDLAKLTEGMSIPGDFTDSLNEIQSGLNGLPSPLTVENLLEFLKNGLQRFPRGIFPQRYFPLIDELREKLETTLRWNDMTGAEIADEVAATLLELAAALRRTFRDESVLQVTYQLDRFTNSIDDAQLTTALDGTLSAIPIVADAVRNGDLSGINSQVAALLEFQNSITNILARVDVRSRSAKRAKDALSILDQDLQDRVLHFLSLIQPPHDLKTVSLIVEPLADLVDELGIGVLLDKFGELFAAASGMLDGINLTSVKDDIVSAMDTAQETIGDLQTTMMEMTISFSALMEQVKDSIEGLGIDGIVDTMQGGLRNFTSMVERAADDLFGPVQEFFLTIFENIRGFLSTLDPEAVVATLRDIISQFTDLLSNPQLLDAIDKVKQAIDEVNAEIADFSFKPGVDVVVEGIDQVEAILKKLATLEIPDFLKVAVQLALDQLNPSLDPVVDALVDELERIIDEGPRKVLLQIKVGPQKLVDIVNQYSPEKLVEECLGPAYQNLLDEMSRFKPSSLLEPIQTALDAVKEQVQRLGDPVSLLGPLDEPFNELLNLLDAFDPEEIISPLSDSFQNGVQTILEILPIGAANAVFDVVANVDTLLNSTSSSLSQIETFLNGVQTRIAGLQSAEQQMQDMGTNIASRIDTLNDISAVSTSMDEVGLALADIRSTALSGLVNTSIGNLTTKLGNLQVRQKLASIAAALQSFPSEELELLPPSLNKTNIANYLSVFDPTSAAIAAPAEFLEDFPGELQSARAGFDALMAEWDTDHLEPNGPIMQLHQPAMTIASLKTMLSETVEQQLTNALLPIMRMVEQVEAMVSGLVTRISDLIQSLDDILDDLTGITAALEEMRDALNSLVDSFLAFDLNFIGESMAEVFDALRNQLMGLMPSNIAAALGEMYESLLGILDVGDLLDATALDAEYEEIIDLLRGLDPGQILIDALQPEFEKILEFILRFDLSIQVDAFLGQIDRLIEELRTELDRVSVRWDDMWDAVPANLSGGISVSVSTSISF